MKKFYLVRVMKDRENQKKTINKLNYNSKLKDLIFLSFEESDDIIFVFMINENKENLFYANPSFYKNLSYSKEEAKKLKYKDIFVTVDKKTKDEVIKKFIKSKSLMLSTSLLTSNGSAFPVNARFYLYKDQDNYYFISICQNQIEKNIIEYRKYISDFLLKNFQKDNIEEDILAKVAESIFVFFGSKILFYLPYEIKKEKPILFYMHESALTKISKEDIIEPFIEIINNYLYLIKIKKEPIVIYSQKESISNINLENDKTKKQEYTIDKLQFSLLKSNSVLIPIYIENKLQAIILIGSDRNNFFSEEINLIRFTFQGLLIFKMKEVYLAEIKYQKECFSDLLKYSLEMHYRQHIPTRKLEYISSACKEITGFSENELLENSEFFWNRIHIEDRKKLLKKSTIKNSQFQNYYEYRFHHKDGSTRWFSDLFVIIKDKDNKPQYIVGSIRDITKQKENEQYLIQVQNQIAQSQKMEALGKFSNEIAHDFNNILAGIKGNTQISIENLKFIEDKFNDIISKNDEFKTNLDNISNNLEDNIKIIKKGIELTSRIKLFSQKKPQKSEIIELNDIINEMKSIFEYTKKKGINIEYILENKKFFIKINKSQLEQVILNIIINAIDSIKSKGNITVMSKSIDDFKLIDLMNFDKTKNYVLILIKDNGCGIDSTVLPRIFEPYFTTKGKKGTGVGLSIVYSIVKQYNGYINVESQLGMGTSFYIYFPLVN